MLPALKAQDKVYLLNGSSKECKVLEISPEEVIVSANGETETISSSELFLIRFKNGTVEIVNTPTLNVVYNPASHEKSNQNNSEKIFKQGNLSVNTLALCNADIAAFYEYIPRSKLIGIGLMGAYNFNLNATAQNLFIATLVNAKKNYDVGATFNFYPGRFENRTTFYTGLMFKYTSFNFEATNDTTGGGGKIIIYTPSKGSQFATLLTLGTHTFFGNHFFIKTIGGLGAFRVKGDYATEYNKILNQNPTGKKVHANYLPKVYFGINVGFNF